MPSSADGAEVIQRQDSRPLAPLTRAMEAPRMGQELPGAIGNNDPASACEGRGEAAMTALPTPDTSRTNRRMGRPWLSFAVKAAISAALIWLLFGSVDWAQVGTRLLHLDAGEGVLCLAILAAQIMATSQRWRIISRIIGVLFGLGAAMRMMWIGLFFNQALPSSIGGDAVRAFLVTREGASFGRAIAVVLCDRVFALLVLVGVMALTLPLMFDRVDDASARWGMTILAGAGLAGFAAFLFLGDAIAHLLRRWKMSRPIGNLAADFHSLFATTAGAAGLFALSTVIHLATVVAVFALADGLGLSVGLIDCLVLVPPILLATMLPLSIAGWGVREGAMVIGFGFVGVAAADALALSVTFGIAQLIIALPGGLLWLKGRPTPPPQAV